MSSLQTKMKQVTVYTYLVMGMDCRWWNLHEMVLKLKLERNAAVRRLRELDPDWVMEKRDCVVGDYPPENFDPHEALRRHGFTVKQVMDGALELDLGKEGEA